MPATISLCRFFSRQAQIARLCEMWANTSQGRGGLTALRGFEYQMLTALLGLVRGWLELDPIHRTEPRLMVEALSDWADLTDSTLIACQVKTTEEASTVQRAMAEFWSIHKTAAGISSELAEDVHYRLVYKVTVR